MSIAYVGKGQATAAGTNAFVTIPYTSVSGNTLIAYGVHQTAAVDTVTDSAGNTWVKAGDTMDAGATAQRRLAVWYCIGANAVTAVTMSGAGSTFIRAVVYEFSGVGSHRQTLAPNQNSATHPAALTPAGTVIGDLVIGALALNQPSTTVLETLDTPASPDPSSGFLQLDIFDTAAGRHLNSAYSVRSISGLAGPRWTLTSGTNAMAVSTFGPSTTTNAAPVANAGADQSVTVGQTVTHAGSGTDADGTVSSYAWSQVSGPTATITNASSATMSYVVPAGSAGSTLVFQLVVTDNLGLSSPADTVSDTVAGASAPAALRRCTFNGVAEGNNISVSALATGSGDPFDQINGSGGTGTALAAAAISGARGCEVTGAALSWWPTYLDTASASWSAQQGLQIDTSNGVPTLDAAVNFIGFRDTAAASVASVALNTDRTLTVFNAAGASQHVTPALTTGSYYITLAVTVGTTTSNGRISLYVRRASDDSLVEAAYDLTTANTGTVNIAAVRYAKTSGTGNVSKYRIDESGYKPAYHGELARPTGAIVAPTVNAGADDTAVVPFASKTLLASVTDPGGLVTGYEWTQTGGPAVALSGTGPARAYVAPGLRAGTTLTFQVRAIYGGGSFSAPDTVVHTVLGATHLKARGGVWVAVPRQVLVTG